MPFEWAKCLILGNGNKVQNLRMLKKLTPEGLAKSADVSEESLKSIECQKIELINTDLTKIANALNVDVELLLDSSMSMNAIVYLNCKQNITGLRHLIMLI